MQNLYWYAATVFEPPKSGRLEIAREDLESYLKATYNDTEVIMLGPNEDINVRQWPTTSLTLNCLTMREAEDNLKHCQNKSTSGPNGVPVVLYKRFPLLRAYLLQLLHQAWQTRTIVDKCQIAEGIYNWKEKEAKALCQYRPV